MKRGPRNSVIFEPHHDAVIRVAYAPENYGTNRGVSHAAKVLSLSLDTVHNRAVALGICVPGYKENPNWTDAENALLIDNAHKPLQTIRCALIAAGHRTTSVAAIQRQLRQLQISQRQERTDAGIYNPETLAPLLGLSASRIRQLIQTGKIKAIRDKQSGEHRITARQCKEFIVHYRQSLVAHKLDMYWLVDVLTGAIK
ncbi:hypothetical protein ACQE3E_06480 [Methylomonas sp. MED-D]|uniref:hypothetical protein n=1 Tax=Methylomonas sp. MED-D TaxID=3418768 RepID=UPI003CFFE28D